MRSHSRQGPRILTVAQFKCEYCSASAAFKNRSGLIWHQISMHRDAKKDSDVKCKRDIFCALCQKQLAKKQGLEQHLRSHYNKRPGPAVYVCAICSASFRPHKWLLTMHLAKQHQLAPTFRCDQCSHAFMTKTLLVSHMLVHTNERHFSCAECGKAFKTLSNLNHHKSVHASEKLLKCQQCPSTFKARSALAAHFKRWHSASTALRSFACSACTAAFRSATALRRHVVVHSDAKPAKCNLCPKAFKTKCRLKQHVRICHGEKAFKCNLCSAAFKWKGNLIRHQRSHSNERMFPCPTCQATFRDATGLQNHRLKRHMFQTPHCAHCEASFQSKATLTKHLNYLHVFASGTIFSCLKCELVFTKGSAMFECLLLKSKKSCTGAGFRCPRCSCKLQYRNEKLTKKTLWKGVTEENRHVCCVCLYQVGCQAHLARHLALHYNNRPYKCDKCSEAFPSAGSFRAHILCAHTREMPYRCAQCHHQHRYKHKNGLLKHFFTWHKV